MPFSANVALLALVNAGANIAHIGHRDRNGLSDGVGVTGLGRGNDNVVNIAAGRAVWGLKVGVALQPTTPLLLLMLNLAESAPPLML